MIPELPETDLPNCHSRSGPSYRVTCKNDTCPNRVQCGFYNQEVYLKKLQTNNGDLRKRE